MAFYTSSSVLINNIHRLCLQPINRNLETSIIFRNANYYGKSKFLFRDRWTRSRGFRDKRGQGKFAPIPVEPPPGQPLTYKALVKPFVFTLGFSTATLTGCTIWQYETIRARQRGSSWFPQNWFPDRQKAGSWRQSINDLWNGLSEADKVFAPVLFANFLVFVAWRIPRFQPTMLKYFASNPAAKVVCWPMFLSTFSHYSFFHLAANMYVLHSFCLPMIQSLGKEQASTLYLSAGVIASFSSFVHKVATRQPGLSVGASGAIMGMLGFVCTQFPDTRLSIIFLPMFTFTAGMAIKVALGVDFLGVVLGWKFFDHAAHLGGALTGIFWTYWGNVLIWRNREPIVKQWHAVRERFH